MLPIAAANADFVSICGRALSMQITMSNCNCGCWDPVMFLLAMQGNVKSAEGVSGDPEGERDRAPCALQERDAVVYCKQENRRPAAGTDLFRRFAHAP